MELKALLISPAEVGASSADQVAFGEGWRQLVEIDPSMEPIEWLEGLNPKTREKMKIPCPGSACWNGHPDSRPANFVLGREGIEILYPDSSIRQKVAEVASRLAARVTEDDYD